MSKLNQYRELERRLAEQLEELERLKQDKDVQKDMEFEDDLNALMDAYDRKPRDVIAILDPSTPTTQSPAIRRPRQLKIYVHPDTGETVETKGGNHKTLKAWKDEHGADTVESWRTQ